MKTLIITLATLLAFVLPLRAVAPASPAAAPTLPTYGDGTAMWAAPEPHEDSGLTWYQVMGILAIAGSGGWGCFQLGKSRAVRIEPQPLTVEMKREFVTRADFEQYRRDAAAEVKRIHERLDEVVLPVAEMKGALDRIAQTQDTILELLLKGKNQA